MFTRIGEATDVVTKEMYDFVDKGDRHVALRPEQTASVCRAFAEHRPTDAVEGLVLGPELPVREAAAWPLPPVRPGRDRGARRRRPVPRRRGDRTRLGVLPAPRSAAGDAAASTSLGEPDDRARYVEALRAHFEAAGDDLQRAEPRDAAQEPAPGARLEAPRGRSRSSPPRRRSTSSGRDAAASTSTPVQSGLRALDIPFTIDMKLVRGLDYYRRTTFEFQGGTLDSAQNALGGGGRYDGLVEALGGPATPGIGFALGVDRTLLACDDEGVFAAPDPSRRRVRRRHDRWRRRRSRSPPNCARAGVARRPGVRATAA